MKQQSVSIPAERGELAAIAQRISEIDSKLFDLTNHISDVHAALKYLIESHELTVMAQPKTRIPLHTVTRSLNDFDTEE